MLNTFSMKQMKKTKLLIFTFLASITISMAQESTENQEVTNSYLEFPRTQVVPILDSGDDRLYELYIRLPAEYADSIQSQYPVIYYTDAMWHVEMLSGSTDYIMEKAILVGISWQQDIDEGLKEEAGAHVSRYRDYSMSESTNQEYQAKYKFGQARRHLTFIREDVIRFVESNYRTNPDHRTYFGYSLGGEFGVYILMTQPNTFKNYILGSPTLRGEFEHLKELDAALDHSLNANVFISYGSEEKEPGQHVDLFVDLLSDRKDGSLNLERHVIEGSHQTAFPSTTVQGVIWLSQLNRDYSTNKE